MSTKIANPRQVKVERALVAASAGLLVLLWGLSMALEPKVASGAEVPAAHMLDAQLSALAEHEASMPNAEVVTKMVRGGELCAPAIDSQGLEGAFDVPVPVMRTGCTLGAGTEQPSVGDITAELRRLKVQGIILRDPPTAVINGRVVQAGTVINHVTVDTINAEGVIYSVTIEGVELKLKAPISREAP